MYNLANVLKRLADASAAVGNLDHVVGHLDDNGQSISNASAAMWAEMYAANCEARTALAELGHPGGDDRK